MTTLMKRLEAATSRLEDLVSIQNHQPAAPVPALATTGPAAPGNSKPPAPSKAPESALTAEAPQSAPVSPTTSKPALNTGIITLEGLNPLLEELTQHSADIDPLVAKQAAAFAQAAHAMVSAVRIASQAAPPVDLAASPALPALFKPVADAGAEVVSIRESNRGARELTNYLATLAEAVPALGWLTAGDAPADFVQEFRDSAQFYGNRVLRENKAHAGWVKALSQYLDGLKNAIASHFAKGVWDPQGIPLEEAVASAGSSTESSANAGTSSGAGAPPPPPPPPSVAQLTSGLETPKNDTETTEGKGGLSAVFGELSQGESITHGLKHVDRKAAKAHLPPKPPLKPKPSAKDAPEVKAAKSTPTRPPSKTLVDKRWVVENFVDEALIELDVEMTQSVLIDNCRNTNIHVRGKAATISVSRSTRVGVAAESLVAGFDVVKCTDFTVQIMGQLPSINLDQSHNGHLYLSEQAVEGDIYTSQTTSINVNLPTGEEGDWKEVPLPEQILHTISDGKVSSKAMVHG